MPTPVKTADKMSVGGAAGGKHWTRSEVESREAAQLQARRRTRVSLKAPAWAKENPELMVVWKDIVKKMRGIELLDNIDAELLALHCDALVKYRACTNQMTMNLKSKGAEEGEKQLSFEDLNKVAQGWMRLAVMLAEKLGLTPGGRARLAKKRAEKIVDEFAESFGG
jgi:P27 family predicted phage terminase small subunit